MSEDSNKKRQWNILTSFSIVAGLGFALMVLGILKAFDASIPPTMIMSVSIASACLVQVDFLITTSEKVPTTTVILLCFAAVIIIVCFPYLPLLSYFDAESIAKFSDVVTLFSFGITILAIGFRGLNEYNSAKKEKPVGTIEKEPVLVESESEQNN